MMRIFSALILALLLTPAAYGSATRSAEADNITSADHSKTYSLPAASDTLTGRASTDTMSNKTISGSNNTFSQLPVASQEVVDTFVANGTTTALTLSIGTGSPTTSGMQCSVDGIVLDLTTDYTYTAASGTVTFVTAPATGQMIKCRYMRY